MGPALKCHGALVWLLIVGLAPLLPVSGASAAPPAPAPHPTLVLQVGHTGTEGQRRKPETVLSVDRAGNLCTAAPQAMARP
jgi:hypothetical protein